MPLEILSTRSVDPTYSTDTARMMRDASPRQLATVEALARIGYRFEYMTLAAAPPRVYMSRDDERGDMEMMVIYSDGTLNTVDVIRAAAPSTAITNRRAS
jgi:hypothetical protein